MMHRPYLGAESQETMEIATASPADAVCVPSSAIPETSIAPKRGRSAPDISPDTLSVTARECPVCRAEFGEAA
jgi:hypothetical protein